MTTPADTAAEVLRGGGVIAYPTDGVFGLGCLPNDPNAVQRVLRIKQRDRVKGLILIAANAEQFDGWIELPEGVALPPTDPESPTTWIVAPGQDVTPLLQGANVGIAVRLTLNATAKSICLAVQSPIVSTSANLSGQPVAENQASLHAQFHGLVDYVVPGDCGPAKGASEIRDLASGEILRPQRKVWPSGEHKY